MVALLVNLLFVALAAGAQSITPGTGRIVGRVVDAETGAPIAGVRVYLNGPVSPTAPWPPVAPAFPPVPPQGRATPATPPPLPDPSTFLYLQRLTSETRADGMFEIRDVPNGRWAVVAQKEGFIANRGLSNPLVEMAASRTLTAADIRLDRGGVITGRVLDARGNPMSRVQVRTTQFDRLGGDAIRTTGGSVTVETNDRGEFRLSGVQPGVHYVVAQPAPSQMGPLIGGTTSPQSPSTHVATFYPGLADATAASPITVMHGKTTPAIEFSLVSVPAYQVSGVVVDGAGRPVAGAIVRLPSRMPFGAPFLRSVESDSNGRFRITNVPAGTYAVMAAVPRVTRNGGAVSGGLSFGDAARPGAAPEVTIQGDTAGLRVVVSQP